MFVNITRSYIKLHIRVICDAEIAFPTPITFTTQVQAGENSTIESLPVNLIRDKANKEIPVYLQCAFKQSKKDFVNVNVILFAIIEAVHKLERFHQAVYQW